MIKITLFACLASASLAYALAISYKRRRRTAPPSTRVNTLVSRLDAKDTPLVRHEYKDPVHEEIPMDVFDRQRVIVGWDQSKIEAQSVLVLGEKFYLSL